MCHSDFRLNPLFGKPIKFNERNSNHLLLLLLIATVFACSDDDTGGRTTASNNAAWVNGFPKIRHGATSVDLEIETKDSSKIYYVVADENLTFTADELVEQAESPTSASIQSNGVAEARPQQIALATIEKLSESKRYFLYVLAVPEGSPSTASEVQKIEFTTNVRQDTASFFSAYEKREVTYLLYRPEDVFKNPEMKYPIVFFLGGFGERATNNRPVNIIQNGLLPEYIHKGNNVPMMVMSIQHVREVWHNELINEAMEYALKNLPVDKNRVFMVGTSGGAFGVWDFAQEFPQRVAAIVPISGGGDESKACRLRNIAVWAFTNAADPLVHPGESVGMIRAINACAPTTEAKLNIFPDRGHDCWRRVFDRNHPDWSKSPQAERYDIFDWLMKQDSKAGTSG
jgi:predicted peptidase